MDGETYKEDLSGMGEVEENKFIERKLRYQCEKEEKDIINNSEHPLHKMQIDTIQCIESNGMREWWKITLKSNLVIVLKKHQMFSNYDDTLIQNEFNLHQKLKDHPFILNAKKQGKYKDQEGIDYSYIIYPYVPNSILRQITGGGNGGRNAITILHFLKNMCDVLAALQEMQIVCLGLRPSMILLASEKNKIEDKDILLTDLSTCLHISQLTDDYPLYLTHLAFMAPEMIDNITANVSPYKTINPFEAAIFSLGKIGFMMASPLVLDETDLLEIGSHYYRILEKLGNNTNALGEKCQGEGHYGFQGVSSSNNMNFFSDILRILLNMMLEKQFKRVDFLSMRNIFSKMNIKKEAPFDQDTIHSLIHHEQHETLVRYLNIMKQYPTAPYCHAKVPIQLGYVMTSSPGRDKKGGRLTGTKNKLTPPDIQCMTFEDSGMEMKTLPIHSPHNRIIYLIDLNTQSPDFSEPTKLLLAKDGPSVRGEGVTQVGNQLFLLGGITHENQFSKLCYSFDTLTEATKERSSLLVGRANFGIVGSKKDYIFIAGGISDWHYLQTAEYYKVSGDQWYSMPPLCTPKSSPALVLFDNSILYCFGGSSPDCKDPPMIERFDLISFTRWELVPLKHTNSGPHPPSKGEIKFSAYSAAAIQASRDEILIFGGKYGLNTEKPFCFIFDTKYNDVKMYKDDLLCSQSFGQQPCYCDGLIYVASVQVISEQETLIRLNQLTLPVEEEEQGGWQLFQIRITIPGKGGGPDQELAAAKGMITSVSPSPRPLNRHKGAANRGRGGTPK